MVKNQVSKLALFSVINSDLWFGYKISLKWYKIVSWSKSNVVITEFYSNQSSKYRKEKLLEPVVFRPLRVLSSPLQCDGPSPLRLSFCLPVWKKSNSYHPLNAFISGKCTLRYVIWPQSFKPKFQRWLMSYFTSSPAFAMFSKRAFRLPAAPMKKIITHCSVNYGFTLYTNITIGEICNQTTNAWLLNQSDCSNVSVIVIRYKYLQWPQTCAHAWLRCFVSRFHIAHVFECSGRLYCKEW